MGTVKEDIVEHCKAIYETIADELTSWYNFTRETWPLLVLLFSAIGLVIWMAKPAPPKHVLMGSGSIGGSYEVITKKYVEYFAKNGVTLELVQTSGAEENIIRLRDPKDKFQAALVQSGLITPDNSHGLQSLGSLAFEPVWFFYREDKFSPDHHTTDDFFSQPMSIGAIGSGTHQQAMHILAANGWDKTSNLKTIPNNEGIEALLRGEISSIFLVDGFESENVQRLIQQNEVKLGIADFTRAAAYTRLMPYFHQLQVPQGSLSLRRNFPDKNVTVIAPTTNLVIDPTMHPAIQLLFLQSATQINGGRNFFSKYGEFPAFKESIIEESPIARRYYEKGSPVLMNYMPFWLAEFIDRMILLLLPLFAFVYPIIKTMPGYRTNRAQGRINEIYGALKFLEQDITLNYDPIREQEYRNRLEEIEARALALRVPKSLVSNYYSLRSSIDFVITLLSKKTKPEERFN